ncbi:MAG TPA: heme-binding protein [Phycisphaerales bacterium]|nr:heme-binding protein [Phycisphaerales bacterium]
MNRKPISFALVAGIGVLGVAVGAGGRPTESAPSASIAIATTHTLTLEGANRVLAAAIAKAKEKSAGGAIAVVDHGGSLIAFQRLDGTFPAGAAVSLGKARTSAVFKKPTKAFEDSINGGRTALAAVQEMTPLQGGVPILVDGHVVGAIGVSGAHSQQEDEEIALAGAAAVVAQASGAAR